jgi:PilZ domain
MFLKPEPDAPGPPNGERRHRVREKVHWQILVLGGPGGSVECMTENLSSEGIFFLSEMPVSCGEVLTCALRVPRYGSSACGVLTVFCQARVVRSERAPDGNSFGIACQLEDYRCSVPGEPTPLRSAATSA